jgi:prolyl 4-hydroxylase
MAGRGPIEDHEDGNACTHLASGAALLSLNQLSPLGINNGNTQGELLRGIVAHQNLAKNQVVNQLLEVLGVSPNVQLQIPSASFPVSDFATAHVQPILPLPPPAVVTDTSHHNIIPAHLQPSALAGSSRHLPMISPVAPVYNGVNPNYPGLRVLSSSPPVFAVDNFLAPHECDFLIRSSQDCFGPAPVVGKGVGEVSPSRTSSTCYLAREDLPDMMRKVSILTGKPVDHCELPQVGRYFPSQQYLQHYDAFDLSTEDGCRFAANGGQRTITVLIYLNDVHRGGATRFPALNLDVQPRRGMALVFFPATIDGMLDKMALHAALPAVDTKFVSQVWIRQSVYAGQPSKRLPHTMGVPFEHSTAFHNRNGQLQQQQQQHEEQQQQTLKHY